MQNPNTKTVTTFSDTPDFRQIGMRIRSTRRRKKLTIAAVAERANIDKGFLSRIERGEKAASVGTLHMIAAALQTSLSVLLGEGPPKEAIRVSRSKDRQDDSNKTNQPPEHHHKNILPAGLGSQLSVMELNVGSEGQEETAIHGGEEVIYVLEGILNVNFNGYIVTLNKNDIINFPGYLSHSLYSEQHINTRVLVIIAGDSN